MTKSQLECSHCNTEGIHDTNDFCKRYIERKKTEDNKAEEKAKANKVEGRDDSPAGGEEEQGKVNRVRATEDEESEEDSDDDEQEAFANQFSYGRGGRRGPHLFSNNFHEANFKSSIKNGHGS